MKERGNQQEAREQELAHHERGQSIVLIALMIVGLVAFAGLAVDVGFLFARNSQFSASADAATLAGVVELHRVDGLNKAVGRAEQFLAANNRPADVVTGTESLTSRGIPQFTFTATWQVDTFFLGVLGFDEVAITKSATAAFYASTDMPLSTARDQGIIRTASPSIFGAAACTAQGDAISPRNATATVPNVLHDLTEGTYTYRIGVPADYITDTDQSLVHIQLFDPDPYNNPSPDFNTYEKVDGTVVTGASLTCNSGSGGAGEACVAEIPDTNPYWFFRVDESYTPTTCANPATGNNVGNVVTRYVLYYLDEDQERVPLTSYTSSNATLTDTDLKWVTPGAEGGRVPTDDGGRFIVDINNIPLDENGIYNIYMDVTANSGTSKNVWDVWAGPPDMATGYSDDVNQRNLEIFRRTITTTNRSRVYARGFLTPHIYPVSGDVELPVAAVDPTLGGGGAYVSVFDLDNGADGTTANSDYLEFTIDTVSTEDFQLPWQIRCDGSPTCDNLWVNPQAAMGIPSTETGVAFYGGDLIVKYQPGGDDHTWSAAVTRGRPFLTR